MTIDMLTAKKRKKVVAIPSVIKDENLSRLASAVEMQKSRISAYRSNREKPPTNPNSSAKVVKMKSVCFSGRKFNRDCVPCMKPLPVHPPDPSAILDCVM